MRSSGSDVALQPHLCTKIEQNIEFTTPMGNFFYYFVAQWFGVELFCLCSVRIWGDECGFIQTNAERENVLFRFECN